MRQESTQLLTSNTVWDPEPPTLLGTSTPYTIGMDGLTVLNVAARGIATRAAMLLAP